MARRRQRQLDVPDRDLLTIGQRLCVPGEVMAVALAHDGEGLGCRQHRSMPRPCMVRMTMGDDRPIDRPRRIDEEGAARTPQPIGCRPEDRFETA